MPTLQTPLVLVASPLSPKLQMLEHEPALPPERTLMQNFKTTAYYYKEKLYSFLSQIRRQDKNSLII